MSALSGRRLGEFVLRELIGEGGFGSVYRCEQQLLGREAVVKVLHHRLQSRDASLIRFVREAQLGSRVDHPYAAHVYGFGIEEQDGLLWIAMERVDGVTLGRRLAERGPMPVAQFVPFFERVAEVVQAAHDRGIVHRDLKPSNIMVVERAGRLLPKLLDFGVARLLEVGAAQWIDRLVETPASVRAVGVLVDPDRTPPQVPRSARGRRPLTRGSVAIGSPPYMAPEQWDDPRAVGPAADLYALGVVAFEALTGRPPFRAETCEELEALHRSAPIPSLGASHAAALDPVIRRALAKLPSKRWGNALQFAGEVREAVDRAARRGRTSRIRRWVIAGAAATTLAAIQYRAYLRAQAAEQVAESKITIAAVEQGRQALLHGDAAEAHRHLADAYRRGVREPGLEFMLARSAQPRLAELARLPASAGRMWSAAFSADGARIVTADDRAARVWDAQRGRLLFELPHRDSVYDALFLAGGAHLVTAGGDGAVRVWAAATAATAVLERELRYGPGGAAPPRYYLVAATHDGRVVAAIDTSGKLVHVWEVSTGAPLAELALDASEFPALAFSADGRWLAATGGEGVQLFDTATWARTATLPVPRVRGIAFNPARPRLVTVSDGGAVATWHVPGGALEHLREGGEPLDAVAVAPSGQWVATAGRGGAVQIWDAASLTLRSRSNHLRSKIQSLEFDAGSALVVAAGAGGKVAVVDAALGMAVTVLDGPDNAVWTARFDRAAGRVVGASWDGAARVWDATAPYRRWSSPPLAEGCGIATGPEPDRRVIAVSCRDRATQVWDTARGELLAELPATTLVAGEHPGVLPAVSPDGTRAAIARGNALDVYVLPGGALLRTHMYDAPVTAVAFGAGHGLISGAADGSVLVTRDERMPSTVMELGGPIDAVGLLGAGRIAVSARGRVHLLGPGGAALAELDAGARVAVLRPSADEQRLITLPQNVGGRSAPPVLWDLATYRRVAVLDGHRGRVFAARFTSDGRILTAGADGMARLWDPTSGRGLQTFRGGARFLADATLSPDAQLVVGGDADGLLWFWDAATGRPLWTLQAHPSHVIGVHYQGDDLVTRGFGGDVARWSIPTSSQVLAACARRQDACGIVDP